MAKIDRLGWAAGLAFESFGVRVGVRATSAEALSSLAERFPPAWKRSRARRVERLYSFVEGGGAGRGPARFHLLYADAVRLARTREAEDALEAFESDAQLFVAAAARDRLFVHAGVVGWRGRAILLPGRSFAGKTTLVAELVRRGAVYYSDEYAVLDSLGRVHPYARPLRVRDGASGRRRVAVEELSGTGGRGALPVGLVFVGEYRAGARWRPRRLSGGQGVLALLAHTVSARREPGRALEVLHGVAGRAPVLKGARGEAADAAEAILDAATKL
ncbi:MAG TPA: hypothetical protein VG148_13895 [Pyrinomonadaceae bacterium]|nr:hypothetical protein [Pyrinomonadaceae bacterium]